MQAKKSKAKSTPLQVSISILQNGYCISEAAYPLKKDRAIALKNTEKHHPTIPYYPLPNNQIDFLQIRKKEVILTTPFKWQGFYTTKGSPSIISSRDASKSHDIVMAKGDYASLYHNDLRMMIKVTSFETQNFFDKATARSHRGSFLKFFIDHRDDRIGLLTGAVFSSFLIGSFILGLIQRPFEKPRSMRDLSDEYMLAFIAPEHLTSAPEILKYNLSRRSFLASVFDHYSSLTRVLSGKISKEENKRFPYTNELYAKIFSQHEQEKQKSINRQQLEDDKSSDSQQKFTFMIPAVVGESFSGTMQRILDKTDIIQTGAEIALEKRRGVLVEFPKDPEYSYEEYKNISKNDKNAEFLSQMRPWQPLSDEQLMYQQASEFGKKAESRQRHLNSYKSNDTKNYHEETIQMPDGVQFATFLIDLASDNNDDKLNHIKAVEYGATPKAKASTEPLIGMIEPNVVEKFIRQNRYQLQICYEIALRRNEEALGVMEWRWRIDSRGIISDVALVRSDFRDRHFERCLQDKISQWRFPRPRRGAVEITYPFEFVPSKTKG